MRRLIISDIPTPWREPVFERVYRLLGKDVHVVYFNNNEKRRLWSFRLGGHPRTILPCLPFSIHGGERFFNPGIIRFLFRHRPKVALITASLKDPTAWLALVVCRALGTKIALLCDTWLGRDQGINRIQRLARRLVYNLFGDAFVGASQQTLAMFKHYNSNLFPEQLFLSHLVADNDFFRTQLNNCDTENRRYDVMFSGRIAAEKNPVFLAKVCAIVRRQFGSCRVLVIGEGQESIKTQMRAIFEEGNVEYEFAGFIKHTELPNYYAQAKLLLLPTAGDCWGVVLNEAMLAGTPVITTSMTAAADELVLHGQNGFILPLEGDLWAGAVTELLTDNDKLRSFSANAQVKVQEFTYDRAAAGILDAFRYLEEKDDLF